MGEAEARYALDAIRSGWISSIGRYVNEFEGAFAAYCGVKHGVTTSNGTVALHLALRTLGVREDDEVIVPDLTFIAVPNAVHYLRARPVLVDCDPLTWCLDPELVAAKISPRTRGIIAVHSYGGVCDMDAIRRISDANGLFVIEDAAEAHGATYQGRRVGGLADVGIFSFYGNKIITTGEGGMLITNDDLFAERARFLKDHAMSREHRYVHPEVGYNYRMTNVQAAIGLGQLEQIDSFLEARDRIARRYRERLGSLPGITFQEMPTRARGVCWIFSCLIGDDAPVSRDRVIEHLAQNGVETRPFFVSLHDQPPYREPDGYPISSRLARQGLNLPTAVNLSDEELDRVCGLIAALWLPA